MSETIDNKNYRVIAELRSQITALTQRAEQAERERDERDSPYIGPLIKAARLGVGKGLRQFAEEIGIVPSRLYEIESGAKWTPEEIGVIAAQIEPARQEDISWREDTVAKLAAADAEVKRLREGIEALKSDIHSPIAYYEEYGTHWTLPSGHECTDMSYVLDKMAELEASVDALLAQPSDKGTKHERQ